MYDSCPISIRRSSAGIHVLFYLNILQRDFFNRSDKLFSLCKPLCNFLFAELDKVLVIALLPAVLHVRKELSQLCINKPFFYKFPIKQRANS